VLLRHTVELCQLKSLASSLCTGLIRAPQVQPPPVSDGYLVINPHYSHFAMTAVLPGWQVVRLDTLDLELTVLRATLGLTPVEG
jgi:hypothetical protein